VDLRLRRERSANFLSHQRFTCDGHGHIAICSPLRPISGAIARALEALRAAFSEGFWRRRADSNRR
jgi:hypothetical protein